MHVNRHKGEEMSALDLVYLLVGIAIVVVLGALLMSSKDIARYLRMRGM